MFALKHLKFALVTLVMVSVALLTAPAPALALCPGGDPGGGPGPVLCTITDQQNYNPNMPGYDLVTWSDDPAQSWIIKLKQWDVDYQPTGLTDETHNPVYTTISDGTGSVINCGASVDVKGVIETYYQPWVQGRVYYTFQNTCYPPGQNAVVSWSGITFYDIP
jgi:hypothetical protein